MNNAIQWYQSNVYRGLIITALCIIVPPVAKYFGYEIPFSETDAGVWADNIMQLFGLFLIAYGRATKCSPVAGTPAAKEVK